VAKAPLAAWIENLLKPHGLRSVGLCEALQGLPVIELREAQATSALVRDRHGIAGGPSHTGTHSRILP
jgi:hypothetical protein